MHVETLKAIIMPNFLFVCQKSRAIDITKFHWKPIKNSTILGVFYMI